MLSHDSAVSTNTCSCILKTCVHDLNVTKVVSKGVCFYFDESDSIITNMDVQKRVICA